MIDLRVTSAGLIERLKLDPEFKVEFGKDPKAALLSAGMSGQQLQLLQSEGELMIDKTAREAGARACCNTGCCLSITLVC